MSKFTKTLATIKQKLKWPENNEVGYSIGVKQRYFNPLVTPPPRSPRSPEDFRNPRRLGHWRPLGFDYTNPLADKYYYHELLGGFLVIGGTFFWLWLYAPDYRFKDWARREAFLRVHKREALGLPLIDPDVIDPDRVHLPTEEEIGDFEVTL